jgi:hypothetical protein
LLIIADLKVEKGIFKVHKSVLGRYSLVIENMLSVPNVKGPEEDGNDENPVILSGDSVRGWERLLESQYSW